MKKEIAVALGLSLLLCAAPVCAQQGQEQERQQAVKPAAVPLLGEKDVKALIPDRSAEIGLEDFAALVKKPGLVVIDLRDAREYARKHIVGSVNLPLTDLTEKTLPAVAPDKNADIVLVCDDSFFPTRRIAMTLQGAPVLKAAGYAHVHRLSLWRGPGGRMLDEAEIEKRIAFEGADVTPPADGAAQHTDWIIYHRAGDTAPSKDAGKK